MGPDREREGTLADFLGFLWRHKLLIGGMVGVSTLAAVVYVLVVPVEYTARATLLPQKESGGGLLSAAASVAGIDLSNLDLPGVGSTESQIQEAVLESERIADLVDQEFDLDAIYGTGNRDRRLRAWYSRLSIDRGREGLLRVGYRDRDPERAARILSSVLDHLDRFNRELRTTSGRRAREFLERRVEVVETRLHALEDSLVAYQEAHRGMALDPSAESVVEAGASMLAHRMRLQAEVEVMRKTLGKSAPSLVQKELEIQALDEELSRLPALNSTLNRLLRNLRVHERTFGFLSAQLEEARLEEARDTPTVATLDPPSVPREKTYPRRTITVLVVFLIALGAALLTARVVDAVREVRSREGNLRA